MTLVAAGDNEELMLFLVSNTKDSHDVSATNHIFIQQPVYQFFFFFYI
jgi:hypothetical protein